MDEYPCGCTDCVEQQTQLPTVEEVVEFWRLVNVGRAAAGLEPVERIDFDACQPCISDACLSATYLSRPLGYATYGTTFELPVVCHDGRFPVTDRARSKAAFDAIGAKPTFGGYVIPESIRKVTDPFDEEVAGLREVIEQADLLA